MEFRFGAGDGWPPGYTPSVPWQAPPRELIIREAVTRRLTEEWAKSDPAFARGLDGVLGPGPFFAPDGFMPPPPPHAPMPMPMRPFPHAPPPVPFEEFGAWQGFGPRRRAAFEERTPFLCEERRRSPRRPDPKHKPKPLEIEPSGRPEALSPKVPMMKRKADANAAATVPKKVQKLAEDWSCALCQVSAPSEAGLNEHLGGREHKAKLAQCGVSKAIKDEKNCLQTTTGNEKSTDPCDAPEKVCMLVDDAPSEASLNEHLGGKKHTAKLAQCGVSKVIKDDKNCSQTTTGNKNSTDPSDAPKKIRILVDGEMHEVVRKNNYLWCDRCRVSCGNNATMACHLRSKKHSKLTKVWTSLNAVRTNIDTKEGLPSTCGSQALSPKVPMMKRKADANAATTIPKKVQKLAEDWSCALCQVSASSEAGLNNHLGGRKHKAKLAQCGVSKAIKDDKNCLQTTTGNENSTDPCDAPKKICMLVDGATCEADLNEHLGGRKHKAKLALCGASKAIEDAKNSLRTTTGNKNSTDPCDAPKKIFLLVDGEMHKVVQKNNYLWCDRCRVSCHSNVIMAGHLRSKKHGKLNKVWTSIKAVRTNTDTKEGLPSCGSQEIPAVIEGDINMTTKVDESGPVKNPVQKEIHPRSKKHSKLNNVWASIKSARTNTDTKDGLPSWGSQVNTNGSTEIPAVIEGDINMTTEVDESGPVENPVQKEITRMATIWAMFSS